MPTDLFDRFQVIDVDTHLTEPPDTWTARFPASRHDDVPHIERIDGQDVWMAGGERIGAPGYYSMAGHDGVMPASIPTTFDDIAPGDVRPAGPARLPRRARASTPQVLYPNVGGFGNGYFLHLGDQELVMECVARVQRLPHRLVQRRARPPASPITALPFWDVDLAVAELQRCLANGHRAVNFCNQPAGLRAAAARAPALGPDLGGGAGGRHPDQLPRRRRARWARSSSTPPSMGWMTNFAKTSSLIFLDNIRCIGDLIFGGVCHRFPDLKFVSVESGVGWMPGDDRDVRLAVAQRRRARRAPRVRPAAVASTSAARSTAASGSRSRSARRRDRARTPTTSSTRPTTRTPRVSTRGRARRRSARATTRRGRSGHLPDDVTRKVLYDNAAALYGLA